MINRGDTIAAVATSLSKSAISIIRLSGDSSRAVLESVFRGRDLADRYMTYGHIVDGDRIIDQVMAVYMPAPLTYTGEDVAEIYCHGSIHVTKTVLNLLLSNGARLAMPGEFTKRAFINGKIDLSQAEAVADVINANTASASDIAQHQLSGRLRNRVSHIMGELTRQIASIEVTVDYPSEDIEETTATDAIAVIDRSVEYIDSALATAERGKIFRSGIRCSIVGQPNVGKSSLLNAILGEARAIVTEIAGTTRDTLEAHVDISGIEVILTDTAGIHSTDNTIERIGVERAYSSLDSAHIVLFVLDMSALPNENDLHLYQIIRSKPHIIVLNKSDVAIDDYPQKISDTIDLDHTITISAVGNEGIGELEDMIIDMIAANAMPEQTELSNIRHINAIASAKEALAMARVTLAAGMPVDLAVVDLRAGLDYLGEITGANVDEDIIDSIFSDFCLGK